MNEFELFSLVLYEHESKLISGYILEKKKEKYSVFNCRGRQIDLPPSRLHLLPGKFPSHLEAREEKAAYLNELLELAERESKEIDVAELWLLVKDEGAELSNSKLALLYFGKDDLKSHLTIKLALIDDQIFFKRKKDIFIPRSPEIIEELKKKEQTEQKKEEFKEKAADYFKALLKSERQQPSPDVAAFIRAVEEVACQSSRIDPEKKKEIRKFVTELNESLRLELTGSLEAQCYRLLELCGLFDHKTNPALIRYRPPISFKEEALKEADALFIPDTLSAFCQGVKEPPDLRQATTGFIFTVDDISTRDMDDAISIEQTDDGFRLEVHIIEVGAVIEKGSLLDRLGLLRGTSIYLPEKTINMLPSSLSENCLSLVAGKGRPALSCIFEIGDDFQIKSATIRNTFIRVSQRFTYDEVDQFLESGDFKFNTLYQIAATSESQRIENGAVNVPRKDVSVSVDQQGRVHLKEYNEENPSRQLVSEMMVMANAEMANYAARHDLPMIYRAQEEPDRIDPAELSKIPQGPARDNAARSVLKKSTVSYTPTPHSGLGLKAYIQATSPIRRYTDLINQRQISHHVKTGKVLYKQEDLFELYSEMEGALNDALMVSRESKRFWLFRYLEQRVAAGEHFVTGTVVRTNLKTPLIELEELSLTVPARLSNVKPGDFLKLRIVNVDAVNDSLKLEKA
jgi:exoribonuclease-2